MARDVPADDRLEVRAADGTPHAVPLFVPRAAEASAPNVVVLPAMGVAASWYAPFARELADALGAVVATPDWRGLAYFTTFALLIFLIGYWWFARTRKSFADVV